MNSLAGAEGGINSKVSRVQPKQSMLARTKLVSVTPELR